VPRKSLLCKKNSLEAFLTQMGLFHFSSAGHSGRWIVCILEKSMELDKKAIFFLKKQEDISLEEIRKRVNAIKEKLS